MFTIPEIDISTLVNTINKYDRVDKFLKNNIDMPNDGYKNILEKQERRLKEIIFRVKKYELLLPDFINRKMDEKKHRIADRELLRKFDAGELDEYIKVNKNDDPNDNRFDEWMKSTLYTPLS